MPMKFSSDAGAGYIRSTSGKLDMYNNSSFNAASNSSIVNAGQILQTVSMRYDTRSTWSVPTTPIIVSDMNISITPKFSTSKIFVMYSVSYEIAENNVWRLGRNGTEIVRNTLDANPWSGWGMVQYDSDNNSTPFTNTYWYIDTPGTTALTTYNLMIVSANGGAQTLYMNRTIGSAGQDFYEAAVSFAMLQEIA
jgi:hypothetical protein